MGTRRKAILVALVVVGALTLFVCAGAIAADPQPVTVSATINPTLQLNMPTVSVTWTGAQAIPGTTVTAPITASVNSNRTWTLKVTANHELQNAGASETIPSADFTFTSTAPPSGTGQPTNTEFGTDITVATGVRGSSQSTTITYRLAVPWDQAPDTYTATHTYTATQP